MKTAEQFFRDKAFPSGINDKEYEEWKHNHKGINWQGFAIKAMEEYAEYVKNFNSTAKLKQAHVSTSDSVVHFGAKFQIGEKAIVKESIKSESFLIHCLEVGQEVEIVGYYDKWRGREAYILKNKDGRVMTEYLLAEELEKVTVAPK